MGSNEWGQYAWFKFHTKAIKYPRQPCNCDIKKIIQYYHNFFIKYISCDSCRDDYNKMLHLNPVRANSRSELFIWTVDIHNIINMKLNKSQIGYNEAYNIWKNIAYKKNNVYGCNPACSNYSNNFRRNYFMCPQNNTQWFFEC